jgi:hypothetical protein
MQAYSWQVPEKVWGSNDPPSLPKKMYSLRSRNIVVSDNENELENSYGSCTNETNKKIEEYILKKLGEEPGRCRQHYDC